MENDSKLDDLDEALLRFGPPLTREPVVVQLAFWEDVAYIAPLGSSLDDLDAWKRVASLDEAADRVGVEWTVKS